MSIKLIVDLADCIKISVCALTGGRRAQDEHTPKVEVQERWSPLANDGP